MKAQREIRAQDFQDIMKMQESIKATFSSPDKEQLGQTTVNGKRVAVQQAEKTFEFDGTKAPVTDIEIDGILYKNMQRIGMSSMKRPTVEKGKPSTVGLSHLDTGLYVQTSPDRAGEGYSIQHIEKNNIEAPTDRQAARNLHDELNLQKAIEYRDHCLHTIQSQYPEKTITIIALGSQAGHEISKRKEHDNTRAYHQQWSHELPDSTTHLKHHTLQVENINQPVNIYHIDIHGWRRQYIDSEDIEKLTEIFEQTYGADDPSPISIHCTDGKDRAGGISLAMYLCKHYDEIFVPGDQEATNQNITAAHRHFQDIRGGNFCTNHEGRITGALQLATAMKAVQTSNRLIAALDNQDILNFPKLADMSYLQQIFVLRDQQNLPIEAHKLLSVLESRAEVEANYFNQFANDKYDPMPHPQAAAWEAMRQIEQDLQVGHNLGSKQEKFNVEFNKVKEKIKNGENPESVQENLKEMQNKIHEAPIRKQRSKKKPSKKQRFKKPRRFILSKRHPKVKDQNKELRSSMGELPVSWPNQSLASKETTKHHDTKTEPVATIIIEGLEDRDDCIDVARSSATKLGMVITELGKDGQLVAIDKVNNIEITIAPIDDSDINISFKCPEQNQAEAAEHIRHIVANVAKHHHDKIEVTDNTDGNLIETNVQQIREQRQFNI